MKPRRKRKVMVRRRRAIDPSVSIDYKKPDVLRRFITDRGKIIPRRISGANAHQQREICLAIKRARYLALLPYAVSHRNEKGFAGDMAALNALASASMRRYSQPNQQGQGGHYAPQSSGVAPSGDQQSSSGDSSSDT